jgi:hypothetical protein
MLVPLIPVHPSRSNLLLPQPGREVPMQRSETKPPRPKNKKGSSFATETEYSGMSLGGVSPGKQGDL